MELWVVAVPVVKHSPLDQEVVGSQLRQNFQASQAVHGANDVMPQHFESQVNSIRVCGPQVDTLIYYKGQERPTLFHYLWFKPYWVLVFSSLSDQ